MQTNTNHKPSGNASSLSAFNWQDGEPSVFATDSKFGYRAQRTIGKAPPLLNGSARNSTTSINTETMAPADKIRRLRRVDNVRNTTGVTVLKTIAACTLLAWAAAAPAQDRWNGDDKPKHLAASAFSAVVVEGLFAQTLHPVERFGLAMLPGVAKEIADMRRGGSGFSWKDMGADAAGVLGGMVFHGLAIRPGYVGINVRF